MSGTSTFFRRKCRLKSEINTSVSTPSKIIIREFESLMREQDKILSTRESALPKSFLSACQKCLENQCGTWEVVQLYSLEVPAL